MEVGLQFLKKKKGTPQTEPEIKEEKTEEKEETPAIFTEENIRQKIDELIAATKKADPTKLVPFIRDGKEYISEVTKYRPQGEYGELEVIVADAYLVANKVALPKETYHEHVIRIQGPDKDAGRLVGARITEVTEKGQEPKKQIKISVGLNHDLPELFPLKERQKVAEILRITPESQVPHK